ncbi:hypothetical protein, partial [Sansalvadorimonas verongulae]|uniref:hypothetical protein n=1 Tax=Sansalvadorimonas verongulae TaxID=2172824 RepID=UPI001E47F9FF
MAQHFEYCVGYPVNCTLCHNAVPRSQLDQHRESECLQRLVDCDRCFETFTVAELNTHKQGCRFMQNMTLLASSANAPVTLVPQPGAIGSIYQPEDSQRDSSTIYLALPYNKFQKYLLC